MDDLFGRLFRTDRDLLEMAEVFRMPFGARLRYLYLPALTGKGGKPETSGEGAGASQEREPS